jgi:hypothetical protein
MGLNKDQVSELMDLTFKLVEMHGYETSKVDVWIAQWVANYLKSLALESISPTEKLRRQAHQIRRQAITALTNGFHRPPTADDILSRLSQAGPVDEAIVEEIRLDVEQMKGK